MSRMSLVKVSKCYLKLSHFRGKCLMTSLSGGKRMVTMVDLHRIYALTGFCSSSLAAPLKGDLEVRQKLEDQEDLHTLSKEDL